MWLINLFWPLDVPHLAHLLSNIAYGLATVACLYGGMWVAARGFHDGKYSSVERFANRTRASIAARKARDEQERS